MAILTLFRLRPAFLSKLGLRKAESTLTALETAFRDICHHSVTGASSSRHFGKRICTLEFGCNLLKTNDLTGFRLSPFGERSSWRTATFLLLSSGFLFANDVPPVTRFDIAEYRVEGAHKLPSIEVEEAVYPFLGPYRTTEDVEQARAALEAAYREKGFQAVSVQIPPQKVEGGVVTLQVLEGQVGRLRIKGSRYFSHRQIKKEAPSLAEGQVIEFKEVSDDILALNQLPDRRITPSLRAGQEPGKIDVDLTVEDKLPLHGSLELNNRYSPNTSSLRANGSISYNNLWQMGHTLGASFQVSPEDFSEVKVFSGYYLAPIPGIPWLSLMAQGTKQDSNVSTLGGSAVAGKGEIFGPRAIITLPMDKNFYHSITLGIDYKHFDQQLTIGDTLTTSPITYYPLSADYSATWFRPTGSTELNVGVNFHVRGVGSNTDDFDAKRFKAQGSYIYLRGDLAHTQDLPAGLQLWGKVQGQAASQPLLDSEQFSGGGLGTVRGYLESEALGDNALFGSVELRSPSLFTYMGLPEKENEWRFYTFCEGGLLTLNEPLKEQQDRFNLASYGVGSRIRFQDHYNGSVDLGVPMITASETSNRDMLVTFRLWANF
jgi:hemolysin activation/secretion protein